MATVFGVISSTAGVPPIADRQVQQRRSLDGAKKFWAVATLSHSSRMRRKQAA